MQLRKLLFSLKAKDFKIQTFCSGGKGGQNQNRKKTGVRIVHPASGATGECRGKNTFQHNKATAFRRLVESKKFKAWHKGEVARRLSAEDRAREYADREIQNVKVEVKKGGRWTDETAEESDD